MTNDLKVRGDVFKNLGNIFAKRPQCATTLRTAIALRPVLDGLAFQMFRKRLACRLVALGGKNAARFSLLFGRLLGFGIFQLQLKLFDLDTQLFALLAEQHFP